MAAATVPICWTIKPPQGSMKAKKSWSPELSMHRTKRFIYERLRPLRSRPEVFVSFPSINSIPPGGPAPARTVSPPPPQPRVAEEPVDPDAPTPGPGLPPFLPPDPAEPGVPNPRNIRALFLSCHSQTDIGFMAAFICSASAPVWAARPRTQRSGT